MKLEELIENPAPMMGHSIDQEDLVVTVGDAFRFEFETIDEAKKAWADLSSAKFAFAMSDRSTVTRQTFAFGEGANRRQTSTGWSRS